MDAVIITGVNRGLGEAIFNLFLEKKDLLLIGVSRRFSEEQKKMEAQRSHVKLVQVDLLTTDFLNQFMAVESLCKQTEVRKIYFFNNAGIVTPIGAVGQLDAQAIQNSFQVNMIAPALMTNEVAKMGKPLCVVNISSGAANHVITGWSTYCGAKAGVRMFLDVVDSQDNVEVVHINPGIMDTGMQKDIRDSSASGFPRLNDFKSFQENGELKNPHQVAEDILGQLKL